MERCVMLMLVVIGAWAATGWAQGGTAGLWMHPKLASLDVAKSGPFAFDADGGLLTVDGNVLRVLDTVPAWGKLS